MDNCGSMRLGLNNYSQSHTAGALRIDDRQRYLKVYSHGGTSHAPVFVRKLRYKKSNLKKKRCK